MTKKSLIKLEEVWKTYTMGEVQVHALRGLTLDIKENEFISIQGASGSGKSTAMNMIGCLDVPSQGRILLDGKDIAQMTESQLAQIRGKKIGFIFQQFNLIPTMTALENVALPMMFQGINRSDRIASAKKYLAMVDLSERVHHKPTEMSGGQQQRVAIARALVNDPEVILADEPTGNLDSKTSNTVMEFLQKFHKEQGKTIIMVTHDPDTARFADRVEFLMDGKIIETKNKEYHSKGKSQKRRTKNE
jgi:putative ABC transport system ATP-binding protein